MAKITFKGLDDWLAKLEQMEETYDKATGKALYEGAKIVADDLRRGVESLPTDDTPYVPIGQIRNGLRTVEKVGLANGMGIARAKKTSDSKSISIGFHGFNKLGKPNKMIARSITSGTSFMKKNNKISSSIKQSVPKVQTKVQEIIVKALSDI